LKKVFFKFKILLLLLIFLSLFSYPSQGFIPLISTEKEIELGKLYLPSALDESEGLYPEEEIQRYVEKIGKRLAANTERKMPYQFYLVNSDVVNAFALPGGPVVITRGIFLTLESESELAGILGHEIGHIEKRHHARFVEKQFALNLIFQIGSLFLPQNLTGELLFQLGQISVGLLSLKFSREQEREADERGFYLLLKAGYSPEGMLRVFERFKKMEESRPPEWLSTHPLPETRIKEWQERLKIQKPTGAYIENTESFSRIKELLVKTSPSFEEVKLGKKDLEKKDYAQAEKHFLKALELYPKNIPAAIYLSRIYLNQKDYEKAKFYAEKALEYDKNLFSGYYLKGLSEFGLKDYLQAKRSLEKARALIPFEGSTHYYLGRIYEVERNFSEALESYKKALEIGPKEAPWYRDCYQRYQRLRGW